MEDEHFLEVNDFQKANGETTTTPQPMPFHPKGEHFGRTTATSMDNFDDEAKNKLYTQKKKGEAKADYAVVVNRSIKHGITTVLRFEKPVTAASVFDKRKGGWEKLHLRMRKTKDGKQEVHYYLPAGDGALLKIERP